MWTYFWNSCIERWLKGQGGKCPQCNAKATRKDIRVLYAKSLKVIDTSERDRVIRELEKEREARRKLELEHAQTKLQYELKSQLVAKLQNELKMLKNATAKSNVSAPELGMSQGISTENMNKLIIHSALDIAKDGGCRVMAYNEWLNMVVVSMPSHVSMFPGCGVKKINMLDIKSERYIPVHTKQIRDMAFNPVKNDLLLTVGMDKLVKLTNVCNNAPVGSFTAESPLWSCCWNADHANQFFVGTATGLVLMYDTRNTDGPIKTIKVTGSGPVVSLCYIPWEASENSCTGGLLVARLSSCSFVLVKENEIQDNALLLEGPFTSLSYEKSTRHFMVSCRPCQKYPHARHLVCELQYVDMSSSAATNNKVVAANIIQTFKGGTTQKVLSRSSIVAHPLQAGSILACASDESTQSTCLWDVSSGACVQVLKCRETVIDILLLKSNQSAFLALLTDKSVKFYKWVELLS
ncbi:E3 ubiquitin-protein ligase RFWD3-like isoform X1 [Macrobrachium nipponense]|uniref:E3 ubiquitin-protein ligase RFWD3-like isoform X1 n=1 Tax=Macrobrachium nipponense TaxID=159736 RepID=UPI0030C7A294